MPINGVVFAGYAVFYGSLWLGIIRTLTKEKSDYRTRSSPAVCAACVISPLREEPATQRYSPGWPGRLGSITRLSCASTQSPLAALIPDKLNRALFAGLPQIDRRIEGYLSDSGILHAVESRASSPVRLVRDKETRQSTSTAGLYPCGEGAGYAGGIMSAALDGIKSALAIIALHKRPD